MFHTPTQIKIPTDLQTEAQAFCAWRSGDERAGAVLMRAYRARIAKYFARHCRDGGDDLVQETILACVRARHRLNEPMALRRYAYVAARRLLARDISRRARECLCSDKPEPIDGSSLEERPMTQTGVTRLHDALLRLPKHYSEAVAAYYLEGQTGPALAERLGVPEGTVRSRIRRGLSQLRRELAPRAPRPAAR